MNYFLTVANRVHLRSLKFCMLIVCLILLCFNFLSASHHKSQKKNDVTICTNDADVVAYSSYKSDKQFIENLRKKYNGLSDEQKLNDLLAQQNYIEVLNSLWCESNTTKRVAWLEEKANEGHPILMFELGEEYYIQNPTIATYAMKTMPWVLAATRRTLLDAACTSDESASAAAGLLLVSYQQRVLEDVQAKHSHQEIENYIVENLKEFQKNSIAILRKALEPFVLQEQMNIPSPRWVFAHGMAAFTKTKNTISEDQYDLIRKKEAEEFLEKATQLEELVKK